MPHISQTNWIDRLPPEVREEVRKAMTRRRFKPSQPIYRGGDDSDTLYQIVFGTVLFRELSADGHETLYGSAGPGSCFGLAPAVLGGPLTGTAIGERLATRCRLSRSVGRCGEADRRCAKPSWLRCSCRTAERQAPSRGASPLGSGRQTPLDRTGR